MLTIGVAFVGSAIEAAGDVVVVANRTAASVTFEIRTGETQQRYALKSGETVAVPTRGVATLRFAAGRRAVAHQVDANTANYFAADEKGKISLHRINLGGDASSAGGRALGEEETGDGVVVVKVKLLVDDNEPAARRVWETRLRKRVAAASQLLERCCRVRLEVAAVETWHSNANATDFNDLLKDFETRVRPQPAQVAIGFTGQYVEQKGRVHLGGTRGPLHSHILLHEWSRRNTEAERLEMLVHELGHWLGAVHTPDPASVMLPIYEDHLARLQGHRIRFDPINTLVVNLFSEELRRNPEAKLPDFSLGTRTRLAQVYDTLAKEDSSDDTTRRYAGLVRGTLATQPSQTLVDGVRRVLRALQQAADSRLPTEELNGDALTNRYVRAAASAAEGLAEKQAPAAFLLALGVALDDSKMLREHPVLRQFFHALEPSEVRERRLATLGSPTMRGRRDLAQHFAVSAMLAGLFGSDAANHAGMTKEMTDASGGSGFSFADLAADKAGVRFAAAVLKGEIALGELAEGFQVEDFMPALDGLPEGLSRQQFYKVYVLDNRNNYRRLVSEIEQRIASLPAYGAAGVRSKDDSRSPADSDAQGRKSSPQQDAGLSQQPTPVALAPLPVILEPAFPNLEFPSDEARAASLKPVGLTSAPDGMNRLFVADRSGLIYAFPADPAVKQASVFLDIRRNVAFETGDEAGLLGLAFHPQYESNGEFFVYYTTEGDPRTSIVSRFRTSPASASSAAPEEVETLLSVHHPPGSSCGRNLAFGLEGYLYIGLGDGASEGRLRIDGLAAGAFSGAVLRIDVDRREGTQPYGIPSDNPFRDRKDMRPEIWAHGLRNIWGLTFDQRTGALWALDSGRGRLPEVHLIARGKDYGWGLPSSGSSAAPDNDNAKRKGNVNPVATLPAGEDASAVGGVVYRGAAPSCQGAFLYREPSGQIRALRYDFLNGRMKTLQAVPGSPPPAAVFGAGEQGEVYLITEGGRVFVFREAP